MWEMCPVRREVLEREVVDDMVTLAVQQWPAEELSSVDPSSQEEVALMHRLAWDVRRMLEVIYGHERFLGLWIVGVKALLPHLLSVMLAWWRKRKDNRAKIIIWRRRWANE